MSVGADLLAVPFPAMVLSLAQAIAKGQTALDLASLNTLKVLASTTFDYLPELTETLVPQDIETGDVTVTGVRVKTIVSDPIPLTLLQAGLTPSFYQFTESIIEVKMAISSKTTQNSEFEFGLETKADAGFLFGSASFSSHVNFKTANTYSYDVTGSSLLRTTLKPTPPPARMMPRFITVNLLTPGQPKVTVSD
jgi:hypothetical protein